MVMPSRNVAFTPIKLFCLTRPIARNYDMRGDEDIILDDRMMADVIAAPQCHIGPDLHIRLDGIVFQDKGVGARLRAGENTRPGADVGGQALALLPQGRGLVPADIVELGIAHRDKGAVIRRWKGRRDLFHRDDGQTVEIIFFLEGAVHDKTHHMMLAVMLEIEMGDLGDLPGSKNKRIFRMAIFRIDGWWRVSECWNRNKAIHDLHSITIWV